jgi:Na+-transporting methylmalonyl-CoA/oxaloacetate decarboxylase gamma subunit
MISVDNIISGGAISISLTGMSIVFSGLLLLSIYIRWLPTILKFLDRYVLKPALPIEEPAAVPTVAGRDSDNEEKDIASVIGLVMQLEAVYHETPAEKEEKDIAHVLGLVLQLENERQLGLPN